MKKFKKYYDYNKINQSQNNNNNINNEIKDKYSLEENNEGKILVINPGDFSKDTLFACIYPLNMESDIYNLNK